MGTFRCIHCGETLEQEAESTCPVCGCRMFAWPYDRQTVLKTEIRNFLQQLEKPEIKSADFLFYRQEDGIAISKATDEKRFPNFETIRDYVCKAEKTEIFYQRLNQSIKEMRGYFETPLRQTYQVLLDALAGTVRSQDKIMAEALAALKIQERPAALALPKIMAAYQEIPDTDLLPVVEKILDALTELSAKIRDFIRQNNIYGNKQQIKPKKKFGLTKSPKDNLEKLDAMLDTVLQKRYALDVFDDGHAQLEEMLTALWKTLWTLMQLPILQKDCLYTLDDGSQASNDEICGLLQERLQQRYRAVNEIVFAPSFLQDSSEEALFDLYSQMIEQDCFGFFRMTREGMPLGKSEEKLYQMIGLTAVKDTVQKIKAYALANKNTGELNLNMCFMGNPGSGKTEVARLIAGILFENEILPANRMVEVDRSGLVSQYFGATAEKTSRVIASAMGGVLFVDEAYALGNPDAGSSDYGREAIDTLVKAMEDNRGRLCVIFAGYKNEMEKMLSVNPGMRSRIPFQLDFPNYTRQELQEIADSMLKKRNYRVSAEALTRILDITDIRRKEPNFANAREIRNILDQTILAQNLRTGGSNREIGLADVNKYMKDADIHLPTSGNGIHKTLLTGEEELENLVGLTAVKRMLRKIKAYAKRNQQEADFNLHMCFTGNPGTGKSEVARILSRILYDAGVLREAKLVETDAYGLLGRLPGETASKTQEKIQEAMGGVLFIDEAYELVRSSGGSAGSEAIPILLKAMEDKRGQFCVIFAGYREEMQQLIGLNPGMKSRIPFMLDFPDYTQEELGEIAARFAQKKGYTLSGDALGKFLDVVQYSRSAPDFANARTVRNLLDQVIMNQNLRTEDQEEPDDTIAPEDVLSYAEDEGIDLMKTNKKSGTIGFL